MLGEFCTGRMPVIRGWRRSWVWCVRAPKAPSLAAGGVRGGRGGTRAGEAGEEFFVGFPDVGVGGGGEAHGHEVVADVGFGEAGADLGEVEGGGVADAGFELDGAFAEGDLEEAEDGGEHECWLGLRA